MYILLDNNRVKEIIPDINPVFPNVPIQERYPAQFVDKLVYASDSLIIEQGYIYNSELGVFLAPEPEVIE